MTFRYGAAALAAGGVTALALVIMTLLIASTDVGAGTARDVRLPLPVALPPPPERRQEFEKPDPPPPPQPVPTDRPSVSVDGRGEPTRISRPPGPTGPSIPIDAGEGLRIDTMAGDSPLVEIMSVRPQYPRRMLARGAEGWVVVVFDVDAAGQVTNARIEASSHAGFERAALEAIGRFRYQPQVVDGAPRGAQHLRKQFTFDMQRGE